MTFAVGAVLGVLWAAVWPAARVTDPVLGHFLEIGLYRDVPRQIGMSFLRLCRAALKMLWPVLVFSLLGTPLLGLLLWSQTHRPIRPSENFIVAANGALPDVPDGLEVTAPPLTLDGRTYTRMRAARPGRYRVAGAEALVQAERPFWFVPIGGTVLYPPQELPRFFWLHLLAAFLVSTQVLQAAQPLFRRLRRNLRRHRARPDSAARKSRGGEL